MNFNVYHMKDLVYPILDNIPNKKLNLKVSHHIKTMDIFRNKKTLTDTVADK